MWRVRVGGSFSKGLLKIIYYMNWAVVFDRLKRSSYTNKIALQ